MLSAFERYQEIIPDWESFLSSLEVLFRYRFA